MSRQLLRLKNLVMEIEQPVQGNKPVQPNKPVQAKPVQSVKQTIIQEAAPEKRAPAPTPAQPIKELMQQFSEQPYTEPKMTVPGKVMLEVGEDIAVKLKVANSDEVIEVRCIADHLAIIFADGKSFHLPLNSISRSSHRKAS